MSSDTILFNTDFRQVRRRIPAIVLVFHGVDGIGWEAKPGGELRAYFEYVKSKEDQLWVATFQDVTKYMRERMHARLCVSRRGEVIVVDVRHDLDPTWYDVPLTLRTHVPSGWAAVEITQDDRTYVVDSTAATDGAQSLMRPYPTAVP